MAKCTAVKDIPVCTDYTAFGLSTVKCVSKNRLSVVLGSPLLQHNKVQYLRNKQSTVSSVAANVS